jgi:hypothetical protein
LGLRPLQIRRGPFLDWIVFALLVWTKKFQKLKAEARSTRRSPKLRASDL